MQIIFLSNHHIDNYNGGLKIPKKTTVLNSNSPGLWIFYQIMTWQVRNKKAKVNLLIFFPHIQTTGNFS